MIPVAEYTSAAEMHAAHKARQTRLIGQPKTTNLAATRLQRENDKLKSELMEAKETIDAMAAQIDEMRHVVSEYQRSAIEYMRQMEELRGEIEDAIGIDQRKPVKEIVKTTLKRFPGVTVENVLSARRSRYLVEARHACIAAVLKMRPDLSYPRIGKFFNRDHTSIIHVAKKSGQRAMKSAA